MFFSLRRLYRTLHETISQNSPLCRDVARGACDEEEASRFTAQRTSKQSFQTVPFLVEVRNVRNRVPQPERMAVAILVQQLSRGSRVRTPPSSGNSK